MYHALNMRRSYNKKIIKSDRTKFIGGIFRGITSNRNYLVFDKKMNLKDYTQFFKLFRAAVE